MITWKNRYQLIPRYELRMKNNPSNEKFDCSLLEWRGGGQPGGLAPGGGRKTPAGQLLRSEAIRHPLDIRYFLLRHARRGLHLARPSRLVRKEVALPRSLRTHFFGLAHNPLGRGLLGNF